MIIRSIIFYLFNFFFVVWAESLLAKNNICASTIIYIHILSNCWSWDISVTDY